MAGAILWAVGLVWDAIDSGGLERHHSLGDWLLLAAFYGVFSLLWPIALTLWLITLARVVISLIIL